MTTHRRYWFVNPNEWTTGGHEQVLEYLQRRCEQRWWFRDPEVDGAPFGRLSFSFTASGRDQWWCHRRAIALAVDVYYMLGLDERSVPHAMWEALAPHTNRGRYRVSPGLPE